MTQSSSFEIWHPADDAALLSLRDDERQPFSQIAARFPGRSEMSCISRYRRLRGGMKRTTLLGDPRNDWREERPSFDAAAHEAHVARLIADGGFPRFADAVNRWGARVITPELVWDVRDRRAA